MQDSLSYSIIATEGLWWLVSFIQYKNWMMATMMPILQMRNIKIRQASHCFMSHGLNRGRVRLTKPNERVTVTDGKVAQPSCTYRLYHALSHIIKTQNAAVLLKSLNLSVAPRFTPNKCLWYCSYLIERQNKFQQPRSLSAFSWKGQLHFNPSYKIIVLKASSHISRKTFYSFFDAHSFFSFFFF